MNSVDATATKSSPSLPTKALTSMEFGKAQAKLHREKPVSVRSPQPLLLGLFPCPLCVPPGNSSSGELVRASAMGERRKAPCLGPHSGSSDSPGAAAPFTVFGLCDSPVRCRKLKCNYIFSGGDATHHHPMDVSSFASLCKFISASPVAHACVCSLDSLLSLLQHFTWFLTVSLIISLTH